MTSTLTATAGALERQHVFRPEIQALRALAVALVVIYHLVPQKLTGGFVGVDVFFVISGYLISDHLIRGLTSTPRLRLRDFYVRRAKRLLPGSLLVLLVVALVTLAVVPQTSWGSVGVQLVASAFYVQNWTLAADSVDYLAADSGASPIQHFWSLSVEEQFYALWPLVLLALVILARRHARGTRPALLAGVGAVTLASFAFSVWATWSSPADAYFITPTRVWEFGAGALLALVPQQVRGPVWLRCVLSWTGLAGIALASISFTSATPFPGFAALLPVTATAAVIFAGAPSAKLGPSRVFKWSPVQFLGDISYSVYLWHWPLIILVPILVGMKGNGFSLALTATIVLLSVVLGWLTKVHVEDRFRGGPGNQDSRRRHDKRVMAAIAAAMISIGVLGGTTMFVSQARVEAATGRLAAFNANLPECYGADALASTAAGTCTGTAADSVIFPDPVIASKDVAGVGCQQRGTRPEVITCPAGKESPDAFKVALVGDSHAGQWLAAVESLADKRGWSVTTYLKSNCAFSSAPSPRRSCTEWNKAVSEAVSAGEYDLILTSAVSTAKYEALPGVTVFDTAVSGFRQAWTKTETPVVALADTPRPSRAGVSDPPSCVDTRPDDQCGFPQNLALAPEPQKASAEGLSNVRFVDMNKYFCHAGSCPAVVGGVLVYRDSNHMTATFSRSLADHLEFELQATGFSLR